FVIRRRALDDPAALDQLDGLYPYLAAVGRRGPGWRRFFVDAGSADDPLFSHQTRMAATSVVRALYAPDMAAATAAETSQDRLRAVLPAEFGSWSPLERAS